MVLLGLLINVPSSSQGTGTSSSAPSMNLTELKLSQQYLSSGIDTRSDIKVKLQKTGTPVLPEDVQVGSQGCYQRVGGEGAAVCGAGNPETVVDGALVMGAIRPFRGLT